MDNLSAFEAAQQRVATLTEKISGEKNKIADANARLASLQQELAEMERWLSVWYDLTGTAKPTGAEHLETPATPKPRRPKNLDREVVVKHALEIIDQMGVPMPRKELFDALARRGIAIHGKDPEMVLSTMLWRSQDKIVRLPNHGYWPTGAVWPDAHYYPGDGGDLLGIAANEPEDGQEADDADD